MAKDTIIFFQGLIRCLEAGMEILELEAKELEESVLPIWVWVVVSTAILLVLGGVGSAYIYVIGD